MRVFTLWFPPVGTGEEPLTLWKGNKKTWGLLNVKVRWRCRKAGRKILSIICSFDHYFKCDFSHLKRYYRNEHTTTLTCAEMQLAKQSWGSPQHKLNNRTLLSLRSYHVIFKGIWTKKISKLEKCTRKLKEIKHLIDIKHTLHKPVAWTLVSASSKYVCTSQQSWIHRRSHRC